MDLKNILLLAVVQLLGLLVSAGFAEYAKKVMWVEEAGDYYKAKAACNIFSYYYYNYIISVLL